MCCQLYFTIKVNNHVLDGKSNLICQITKTDVAGLEAVKRNLPDSPFGEKPKSVKHCTQLHTVSIILSEKSMALCNAVNVMEGVEGMTDRQAA